jgi:site-specific DNA-methyltransferase (adenine-specific)
MKQRFKLMLGDNIQSLKKIPDNSIDSIVTDPPYGISFMNRKWDYDVPSVQFWKEVYRVLKPGGHILSFGGTRTYHRMVVNIEDAGFEIRDQIQWIYGSGFPKSHNIGKAVDKLEGNEREVVGKLENYQDKRGLNGQTENVMENAKPRIDIDVTKGTSPYEGWGTALKPANEPICVARKPLSEKSVAENVLKWGTGGINVDGCRVGSETIKTMSKKEGDLGGSGIYNEYKEYEGNEHEGRFPANIILECICDEVIKGEKGEPRVSNKKGGSPIFGSELSVDYKGKWPNDKGDTHTNPNCPCYLMDQQSGFLKGDNPNRKPRKGGHRQEYVGTDNNEVKNVVIEPKVFDSGGASRFFYQAKVSKAERNMGLDGFEEKQVFGDNGGTYQGLSDSKIPSKNTHPTLKPINLMVYLCRLVTPEGGIVLDPFCGSGSTGVAALLEGFRFVGMEMDKEYFKIAEARIDSYEKYKKFKK